MSEINISKNACKGTEDCGICIFVCPKGLFAPSDQMNERGYLIPRVTDVKQCTECLSCMVSCPDMAIAVTNKEKKAM